MWHLTNSLQALIFCADVIGILSILSKWMQKENLLYSSTRSQVDSSITAVMILGEKDGPYMEEFQTLVAASPPTEFPMGTRFMSHDISDSERQRNEFLSVRKSMVSIAWRTGSLIQGL